MRIKLGLTTLILAGTLLWSGCTLLPSPGEVIKAPQQVSEQDNQEQALIKQVQSLLPAGAKLVAPANPAGAKAVQQGDLDGDGQEEVVATYSIGTNPGQLMVSVFKEKEIWNYEGTGYALDWFSISDVTGDKQPELLLGWTVGASAGNGLDIFTWQDNTLTRLTGTGYHKLEVEDMPGTEGTDGQAEIALWQRDTGDAYSIEVLRWQANQLVAAEDVYPYYFKRVVEYYGAKVKEMPEAALYWYCLADAQVKSNAAADALQSIETGLALKADYPQSYKWQLVKGEALNKLGKYQEACEELQQVISSLEKSTTAYERTYLSQAYRAIARSYEGLQDHGQAKQAMEKAKQISEQMQTKSIELISIVQ